MKKDKFKVQVDKKHYFKEHYLSPNIFLDYFNQINLAIETHPKKILEVGIGNGSTALLLENFGYNVVTCDFDKKLKPDYVADIRKLPFRENEFDTVLAFEILEHIPFSDVSIALNELKRISKKHVIISVPRSCISFDASLRIVAPYFFKIINFSLNIPYRFFTSKKASNPEHYWALERKGFSKKKFLILLKKFFKVKKHFSGYLNSQHYYFVLEK